MMGNITFFFLIFAVFMYESLHVAVKMYINYSFFTFIIRIIRIMTTDIR